MRTPARDRAMPDTGTEPARPAPWPTPVAELQAERQSDRQADRQNHVEQVVQATWRAEAGRIVGAVARLVRDVGLAEDLAQDALETALRRWPVDGLPDQPGAWLTIAARRRALDHLRRASLHLRSTDQIARDREAVQADVQPDFVDALDARRADPFGDDQLRLMFIACHPMLSADARVALTLKLLGGLQTDEIARACLTAPATIAQRIVRAKRTLGQARLPFEMPPAEALAERLDSVLQVVYLIFNEGYTATSGDHWLRADLCHEAIRLGRRLAAGLPRHAEVLGLLALMLLQASRLPARTAADGSPVLLADQDRSRWDAAALSQGREALGRALALSGPAGPAPYTLQAAIAACHSTAANAAATDWRRIRALYDRLWTHTPTPVVALNRVVAIAMAEGAPAAMAPLRPLLDEPALQRYPWLHAVHGDLLERLGQFAAAAQAQQLAAECSANDAESALMRARAQHNRSRGGAERKAQPGLD